MILHFFFIFAIVLQAKAAPKSTDEKSGNFKSALRQFIEGNAYDLTNYDTLNFNEQLLDDSFY